MLVIAAAGTAACNTCGTFSYRGYEVEEHCGVVYGTTGRWFRGDGVVELQVGSSAPVGRTQISFRPDRPDVRIAFPDIYLRRGTEVPAEDVAARCALPDGAPLAVEQAEVFVRRRGTNLDLDPVDRSRYRRFSWSIRCAEGVIRSEATDVVELEVTEGFSDWPAFPAYADDIGSADTGGSGDGADR
jgi:hypothetical protein